MNIEKAKRLAKEKLPEKRYNHSLRVAETAIKLAEIYDGDTSKVELAGVLHDFCKYDDLGKMYQIVRQYELGNDLLSYGSEILHGPVCAAIMEHEYGINDEEVLMAIKYHTTGRQQMTKTEKLIFIADYIEPGRTIPGVDDIRDMAYNQGSLDKTIYEISKRTVLFLIQKDITVYNKTIDCLNYYNYSDERIKDDEMNSQELLAIAVDAIDNKKGEDTISLEMKGISDMTDYFVVTHGNNERQVQAIARAVKEVANEQNIEVKRMEGYNEARWILIDLADVVVHVFHKDERNYYNIEKLYQDAPLESYSQVAY